MTKHYVDKDNNSLGGFPDEDTPPRGSIEVPAPKHGLDTWDGSKWNNYVIPAKELRTDKIRAALDDDEFKDLILDIAQAINKLDPLAIRQSLKDKVRDALL